MKKLLYSGLTALMLLFAIGFAQADNAKVKVELNPTTWTIGATAPQFTVTITQATTETGGGEATTAEGDALTLGASAGNVAVKVTLSKDGTNLTQTITETPVALTTTGLTAGTWTLAYDFVKGEDQSTTFENVDNDASTASLTVEAAPAPETLEAPTIMATTGATQGFVAKGTQVNILGPDEEGVDLWYTVDGTTPAANIGTKGTEGAAQLTINESMTIKAIAVKGTLTSNVTEAEFKLPEDLKDATVMIAGAGDKILKNYPVALGIVSEEYEAISDARSAFYYTMDGETEPSMEAYEAQTDKVNGAIKAIEFGEMPYFNPTKNSINLKIKGYAMVGETLEAGYFTAATLDTVLTVESEVNPEITVAHEGEVKGEGVVVKGDTIVIKNNSETRGSSVYFSLDGTAPIYMTMLLDEEDEIVGTSIFHFDEEIKIVIDQNENGAYTAVFEAMGDETEFLVKDGKISIQAICYAPEGDGFGGASVMKGSDVITAEYTIARPTVALSLVTPSRTGGSYAKPDTTYGTSMPEFSVKVEGVELGYDVMPVSAIYYQLYRFIEEKDSLIDEDHKFGSTFEIGELMEPYPNDTYKMVIRVEERSAERNADYEWDWTPYTDADGKVAELTVYFEIAAPAWTLVFPELKTVEGEDEVEYEDAVEPFQLRRGKDMKVVIATENCEGLFGNGEDKMIIRKKVSVPSLMKNPMMFGDRGMIQNDGYVIYDTMIPADGNIVWTLPEGWVDSVKKFITAEVEAMMQEMEEDDDITADEIAGYREQLAFKDEEDLSDCKISVMAGTMMDMSEYGRGIMFQPAEEYPSMLIEVPFTVIDTIYAPTLSLESGEVTVNTDLWITADLATDTIYYSVDEGAFQKGENNNTVTILLDKDMKVAAYAIGKDGRKSNTVSATYTVVEEPEDSELTVKAVEATKDGENYVFNGKNVAFDMLVKNKVEGDSLFVSIYTKEQYDTMGEVEPTKFAVADSVRFTTTLEYGEYVGDFTIVRKSDMVGETVVGEAVTVHFTVKEESANEAAELAGVNVYPNPNAGAFNVAVPERALVEIFGLNGAKVMSREVNAGVEAFNLDHSGIYFIRVMAGNKTAVKRVVVR